MIDTARAWLAVGGAAGVAVAAVVGLSAASAVAEPSVPIPPAPATVTQTVTIAPGAPAPMGAAPVSPQSAPLLAQPSVPVANVTPALAASPAAPTPTLVPATSGTLTDYFKSKNVKLEPQKAQNFKALSITLPMPVGWSQVPDPNVPDAFLVIANRNSPDLYTPNAALVVYKLTGDFDPKEAITHGLVDSEKLPAWQSTDASLNDFYGMPSALIEGTYRSGDLTLNTSRRHVIATSGADRFLVSLSVTTVASSQGVSAAAAAADAVVNGYRVSPPIPAG
ncbi:MAG: LpqN/LpqT family lipoprotein [Mycobacteriaceae bacterium]|nr:LpqN/LpqT family lipoprotein [Mycobacteriaceae bacterium]